MIVSSAALLLRDVTFLVERLARWVCRVGDRVLCFVTPGITAIGMTATRGSVPGTTSNLAGRRDKSETDLCFPWERPLVADAKLAMLVIPVLSGRRGQ
jgi:hypothetical protein